MRNIEILFEYTGNKSAKLSYLSLDILQELIQNIITDESLMRYTTLLNRQRTLSAEGNLTIMSKDQITEMVGVIVSFKNNPQDTLFKHGVHCLRYLTSFIHFYFYVFIK